jgi:hypothetical protein
LREFKTLRARAKWTSNDAERQRRPANLSVPVWPNCRRFAFTVPPGSPQQSGLSLVPYATRWIGESGLAPLPTALYGGVLQLSAIAYTILVRALLVCQPPHSVLANAIGSDFKGNVSLAFYVAAIPLTFVNPVIAVAMFAFVALMWLVPDRRIEARVNAPPQAGAVGE